MKRKKKRGKKDFDQAFDDGEIGIDFSKGVVTEGLSKVVTIAPITVPGWVDAQLEGIAKMQANSKASVIRQLLVEALLDRRKLA